MSTSHLINTELSQKAAELAAKSGVDPETIIDGILRSGLSQWEKEFDLIEAAAQQADRGEFVSNEKLQAMLDRYKPAP